LSFASKVVVNAALIMGRTPKTLFENLGDEFGNKIDYIMGEDKLIKQLPSKSVNLRMTSETDSKICIRMFFNQYEEGGNMEVPLKTDLQERVYESDNDDIRYTYEVSKITVSTGDINMDDALGQLLTSMMYNSDVDKVTGLLQKLSDGQFSDEHVEEITEYTEDRLPQFPVGPENMVIGMTESKVIESLSGYPFYRKMDIRKCDVHNGWRLLGLRLERFRKTIIDRQAGYDECSDHLYTYSREMRFRPVLYCQKPDGSFVEITLHIKEAQCRLAYELASFGYIEMRSVDIVPAFHFVPRPGMDDLIPPILDTEKDYRCDYFSVYHYGYNTLEPRGCFFVKDNKFIKC